MRNQLKKLPLLHQAIVNDDLLFIKKERENPLILFSKDQFGFSPKELALLLGKRGFAEELGYHPPSKILVQDEELSLIGYEEKFNVKFSPTITFSSYENLVNSLRETPYTLRYTPLGSEMKRKGILYKEDLFNGIARDLRIRFIDKEIGYGLFAGKSLYDGEFIGEYAGVVKRVDSTKKQNTTYLLHYPTRFFSLNMHVIDANYISNFTRFINHSNRPNLRPEFIIDRGLMHIALFANQPIPEGTELTVDYGKDYWVERHQRSD